MNNNCKIKSNNNKFKFIYLGYDSDNNLIYFRNGTNQIKATDILDLFNIFNKNIMKFSLIYEKITIIFDKNNSELKIINHLIKNKNNIYYFPLKNFADFVQNFNDFTNLKIEGFDFTFEDIKNKKVKKIYLNYMNDDDINNDDDSNIFEYKYDLDNIKDKRAIDEDMNLKMNFPELDEINIGNISNEKQFYKKLINSNDSKIKFNIISLDELKKSKKNNVNIIYKEKYNEDEENYEDEENVDYEYEENNLINDKYEDDGDVVVNDIKIKNKKFKKEKEIDEDVVCCVREYLDHYNSYRLIDEKTIKNMLKLNSKIITTKRG